MTCHIKMADARQMTENKTFAFIDRSISDSLNDFFKSFLSKPVKYPDLNTNDGKRLQKFAF